MRAGVPVVLVAALLVQVGVRLWRQQHPAPPTGPATGDVLPLVWVAPLAQSSDSVRLTSLLTQGGGCSLLVVVSTTCHYSARMRYTWPEQARLWTDSVGVPLQLVWLAGEEPVDLLAFYRGYDLRGVRLLRVTSSPAEALARLGVFGTPTTYLVDASGRLRLAVMGNRLPPATAAREACS